MLRFAARGGKRHGYGRERGRHSGRDVLEQEPVIARVEGLEHGRGCGDGEADRQDHQAGTSMVSSKKSRGTAPNAMASARVAPGRDQAAFCTEIHDAVPPQPTRSWRLSIPSSARSMSTRCWAAAACRLSVPGAQTHVCTGDHNSSAALPPRYRSDFGRPQSAYAVLAADSVP